MINVPITKLLFIDIETVGGCKNLEDCKKNNPFVADQFVKYFDWFLKRFPEDDTAVPHRDVLSQKMEHVFFKRASLVPEFAKIVCVSMGFVLENGSVKKQSFSSHDEKEILIECQKILNRCGNLGFYLCGHNLKNFDIPMLAKRMIINNLQPPSILPSYDTKPWEIKAIDTKEIWQYGSYTSIGSLDLLCSSLGIESSKDGEIKGENVHENYWINDKLSEITLYCEKDVDVLIEVIKKLKNLIIV